MFGKLRKENNNLILENAELNKYIGILKSNNEFLIQDNKEKTKTIKDLEDLIKSLKEELNSCREKAYELSINTTTNNDIKVKTEKKVTRKPRTKKEVKE